MIVGSAEVEILTRLDNIDQRLEKALGDAADKAGGEAEKRLGDRFKSIGANMSKYVTLPVVAGFGVATKAASDLGEQTSKTETVFASSSGTVKAFAKDAASSLGISERAALEAAGTFGNLFRSFGINEEASAKLSTQLVTTAADLASFNNATPEEALEALRAGLTGEAEPLKRFGININEARIQQEALNLGLIQAGDALTAGAKAQAVYSLVQKDSALATGDFAKTSGSLANQMRITKAEFENTAAEIGQKLIPAALQVAKVIQAVLDVLGSMPDAVSNIALIGLGFLAAAGPIASTIGSIMNLQTALRAGGAASNVLATGLKGLSIASGVGIAILGIATAVQFLNKESKATEGDLARVQQRLLDIAESGSTAAAGSAKFTKELDQILTLMTSDDFDDKGKMFDSIDKSLASLVSSGNTKQAAESLATIKERMVEVTGQSREQVDAIFAQKGVLNDYRDAVDSAKVSTEKKAAADADAQKAAEANKDETQKSKDAYDTLAKSIDETKAAMDRYLGQTLELDEAYDAFKQTQADADATMKENGLTFDANTQKGRDNRAALRDVVESTGDLQRAMEQSSGVSLTDAQRKQKQIDLLNEYAKDKSPAVRAEIDRYIAKIREVPEKAPTTVTADTTQATSALDKLITKYGSLQKALVGVSMNIFNGFMAGGPVSGGQVGIWNEVKNGGEVFVAPSSGGYIVNNLQAREAVREAASVGGNVIQVEFAPVLSGASDEMIEKLQRYTEDTLANTLRKVLQNSTTKVAA